MPQRLWPEVMEKRTMKAFRGQPSIYDQNDADAKQAELEIRGLSLHFGGVMALGDIDLYRPDG